MISSVVVLDVEQTQVDATWSIPVDGVSIASALVLLPKPAFLLSQTRLFARALTAAGYSVLVIEVETRESMQPILVEGCIWLRERSTAPSILVTQADFTSEISAFSFDSGAKGLLLVSPWAATLSEPGTGGVEQSREDGSAQMPLSLAPQIRTLILLGGGKSETAWVKEFIQHQPSVPDLYQVATVSDAALRDANREAFVKIWADNLLDEESKKVKLPEAGHHDASVHSGTDHYYTSVIASGHSLILDEPAELGGKNRGPTPMDMLLSALGACSAITARMYASRKNWPLEDIHIDLSHQLVSVDECEDCDLPEGVKGRVHVITRAIQLQGPLLTDEMKSRIMDIADKCPVHRTISDLSVIKSRLVPYQN